MLPSSSPPSPFHDETLLSPLTDFCPYNCRMCSCIALTAKCTAASKRTPDSPRRKNHSRDRRTLDIHAECHSSETRRVRHTPSHGYQRDTWILGPRTWDRATDLSRDDSDDSSHNKQSRYLRSRL